MQDGHDREDADLDLLCGTVAASLRERGVAKPPARRDYSFVDVGRLGDDEPDVQVVASLGRDLRMAVHWGSYHLPWRGAAWLSEAAREFADALEGLSKAREGIRSSMREIRAATRREVADANRDGLPWRILSLSPSPYDLGLPPAEETWLATVVLEVVGESPKPARLVFEANDAEDVEDAIDEILDRQTRLAGIWTDLASQGATGTIHPRLHDDLVAAGHDMPAVLRELSASDSFPVDVAARSGVVHRLIWREGMVDGGPLADSGMYCVALAGSLLPVGRGLHALLFDAATGRTWHRRPLPRAA